MHNLVHIDREMQLSTSTWKSFNVKIANLKIMSSSFQSERRMHSLI